MQSHTRTNDKSGTEPVAVPAKFSWIPAANVREDVPSAFFEHVRPVGAGVSSRVMAVRFKRRGKSRSKRQYALKAIPRGSRGADMFAQESSLLWHVRHPGVLQLHNCFVDRRCFYLLLDLGDDDLFSRIVAQRGLPEGEASVIVRRLLEAVQHLHGLGVAHRDIKPENVLFTARDPLQPKLCDFGDADIVDDEAAYDQLQGTPVYLSPERWRPHRGWEIKASDVWAVGVLTFEAVTGRRCFSGSSRPTVRDNIVNGCWRFPSAPRSGSPLFRHFVTALLARDPRARVEVAPFLSHPWVGGSVGRQGRAVQSKRSAMMARGKH